MAAHYTLTPEDIAALQRTATRLGTRPERLLAVIDYETQGTLNPDIIGGEGNNYQGLIQFGPTERRAYGYTPGMGFAAQVEGPVYNYLEARGLPYNASISSLYRTINGGNPNAPVTRRDANGTIAQHIARIEANSLPRAQDTLAAGGVQVAGGAPAAGSVPLPRISPAQRAMAQTAPVGTEAISYQPEANPFPDMLGGQPAASGAPANPPDPQARPTTGDGYVSSPTQLEQARAASQQRQDDARALHQQQMDEQQRLHQERMNAIKPGSAYVAPKLPSPAYDAIDGALNLDAPVSEAPGLSVRVKRGDTLWDMAATYYGDGRRWTEIQAANGGVNPKSLLPGMVLTLPGVAGPPTPPARPGEIAARPGSLPAGATKPETATKVAETPSPPVEAVSAPPATPPPVPAPAAPTAPQPSDLYETSTMLSQFPEAYAGPAVATQSPTSVANSPPAPPPSGPGNLPESAPERRTYPQLTHTQKQFDQRFTQDENLQLMPDTPLVPSVLDRVGGAVSDLGDWLVGSDAPAIARPEPSKPIVPPAPAPTKDQSRITPDLPSQRQPAVRVAPPRDAVGGTEKPGTSVKDFLPLEPSIVDPAKPPPQVSDLKPMPGGMGYSYVQNGYAVTSLPNGIATRAPLPSTSSTTTGPTQMERWNASTGTWQPAARSGGSPVTNATVTPVAASNASAALPGRPY